MISTLTPAYGRDYKTKKEFIEDLKLQKDFKLVDFMGETYCTLRELLEVNVSSVYIRYRNLSQKAVVDLKKV